MELPALDLLYQDEFLIAIDKPAGLLVHRGEYTQDEPDSVLDRLNQQLGQHVYIVHRLDRATAGVMILALQREVAVTLNAAFANREIQKTYHTIVRGFTEAEGLIDRDLRKKPGKIMQPSQTRFRTLRQVELPIPVGRYETVRYSMLEVEPLTGRYHQIRRHLSFENHPILGDRKHGDKYHNAMLDERFGRALLMLQASEIELKHPVSSEPLHIVSPLPDHMQAFCDFAGWNVS
ncbi:MAG: pseudouridine synthase [Bacteroidota bacterium]